MTAIKCAAIALLIFLTGCAADPTGCALTAHESGIGNGGQHRIRFEGDTLSVYINGDRDDGAANTLVWHRTLSSAERTFLIERIDQSALKGLKESYDSPYDGAMIAVDIKQTGQEARMIVVTNYYLPQLARMCDALDALLPPKYRLDYWEWIHHSDDRDDG